MASTAFRPHAGASLTGANLANRDLMYLGVSGDGDSASIGLGQFAHCIRRSVNMTYIVENNGVYGLTKGSFQQRPIVAQRASAGFVNHDEPIDLVQLVAAARGQLYCPELLR